MPKQLQPRGRPTNPAQARQWATEDVDLLFTETPEENQAIIDAVDAFKDLIKEALEEQRYQDYLSRI